jgi:hypothetical protein
MPQMTLRRLDTMTRQGTGVGVGVGVGLGVSVGGMGDGVRVGAGVCVTLATTVSGAGVEQAASRRAAHAMRVDLSKAMRSVEESSKRNL